MARSASRRRPAVDDFVHGSAYLPIFSRPDGRRPSRPVFARDGRSLIGMDVHEELHRMVLPSAAQTLFGDVRKVIGERVAGIGIRWRVMPDDFVAAPHREPPPTRLDPSTSQRFCMLDGTMQFRDRAGSGFHGFGQGRTFPSLVRGRPQLAIAAVVEILEGFGDLRGARGTVTVSGYIEPPFGLALSVLVRLDGCAARFENASRPDPPRAIADPDSGSTFVPLLGETVPSDPVRLRLSAAGAVMGAYVSERLRSVQLDFQALGRGGLRATIRKGPVVGTLTTTLSFNPLSPDRIAPIHTESGRFTFMDANNRPIGTIDANVDEGWAFRSAAGPAVFSFGGFGQIGAGAGAFAGVQGQLSLNGVISVMPQALANLYVLRLTGRRTPFGQRLTPSLPGAGPD